MSNNNDSKEVARRAGDFVIAGEWAESVVNGEERERDEIAFGYVNDPFAGRVAATVPYRKLCRHTLVTGATGYGKSATLVSTLEQIAENGDGFCYVDPKGDDSIELLRRLPSDRLDDVVFLGVSENELAGGIDLLTPMAETETAVDETVNTVIDLIKAESHWGPKLQFLAENAIRMAIRADCSISEIDRVFEGDEEIFDRVDGEAAEVVREYIEVEERAALDPLIRRAKRLQASPQLSEALEDGSTSSLSEVVDEGKILIVRSAFDSAAAARVFSSAVVRKVWEAVRQAERTDADPFFICVDEADAALNELPSEILSTARSHRVGMITAVQHLEQLPKQLRNELLANCANLLSFNPSNMQTANEMAALISGVSREELLATERFEAWARLEARHGRAERKLSMFPPTEPLRDRESVERIPE